MDWILLFHKKVDVPFVPSYNGLSDTSNFAKYSNQNVTDVCNDVDQSYFDDF